MLERRGNAGWLTIKRADKANALTIPMMQTMRDLIEVAAADAALNALVLTGQGTRAFSGGVDVRTATGLADDEAKRLRSECFFELIMALARLPKPVIAAMNGVASGGGAMIALLADHVIAVKHAAIAMPEIDLGGPTMPGLAILTFLAGAGVASDLVQSGRRMPAAEALAHGLIHRITSADTLGYEAERAAAMLGDKPSNAFALNKQWLREPLIAALARAHEEHRRLRAAGAMH